MIWVDQPVAFWLMTTVQIAGLFSLALTRVGEHTTASLPCRRIFFACLLLVGLATMLSVASRTGHWTMGGATLSLMVVGSTLDLRSDVRRATSY